MPDLGGKSRAAGMIEAKSFLSGIGLISGKQASVEIEPLPAGSGIVFRVNGTEIPARSEYVVNTDRGITLRNENQNLSIVEHFLAACAIEGYYNLQIEVTGAAELPILDGSALPWIQFLRDNCPKSLQLPKEIPSEFFMPDEAISFQDPDHEAVRLLAIPSEALRITCLVDFPHPDLVGRWFSWSETPDTLADAIAPARTFGFVSELPTLQERGLALGANRETVLGLTEDGGYTADLRFPEEPIRHKILDLVGDLMLCGIPIRQLKAHIIACCASHAAHIRFGELLFRSMKSRDSHS